MSVIGPNSDIRPLPSSDLSARLEIILPAAYPSENVAIAGSLGRVHQRRGALGPSCTINPVLSGATYMPTQFFSGRYPIQRVGTSLPGRRPANRTRWFSALAAAGSFDAGADFSASPRCRGGASA